ncbi:MAG: ABC transporter substrate-binding protein [Halobacteriota archaeon]
MSAQDSVPSTDEEIEEVARAVLANEIMLYLRATYFEEEDIDCLSLEELRESAGYYPQYPRQITDSVDRTVTIYRPIERIVVTDDNHAELIRLIGAENKVVGIEGSIQDRGYFPVMSDKPDIGNQWSGLNYELIAELNPDVVIMLGLPFVPVDPVLKKLDEIGVKAVCIDPIDIDKRANVIMLLGYILEETDRATDYCEWREEKLGIVSRGLEDLDEEDKPKYVAKDTEFRGYFGKGYTMTKTIEMAGMRNIAEFHGMKVWVDLSWILEAEPEVFILGDWESQYVGYKITSTSNAEADINGEIDKPGFEEIPAVKNGSVYEVEYMLLGTRGDIGVLYLAKMAHPDKFPDNVLDPVKIHREYFEDWLRVDYQGIFFYPHT